jgi:hypothetical protein
MVIRSKSNIKHRVRIWNIGHTGCIQSLLASNTPVALDAYSPVVQRLQRLHWLHLEPLNFAEGRSDP